MCDHVKFTLRLIKTKFIIWTKYKSLEK